MSKELREAHLAIDNLVQAFAEDITVAQLDVADIYDDHTLDDVFTRKDSTPPIGGSHIDQPIARRFARMLVERLLHHEGVVLGWDQAEHDEWENPTAEPRDWRDDPANAWCKVCDRDLEACDHEPGYQS